MTKLERKYPGLFIIFRAIAAMPRGRQAVRRGLDWYAGGGELNAHGNGHPANGL
jgi:hypothetical protein